VVARIDPTNYSLEVTVNPVDQGNEAQQIGFGLHGGYVSRVRRPSLSDARAAAG